jgi:hypothetical protein
LPALSLQSTKADSFNAKVGRSTLNVITIANNFV